MSNQYQAPVDKENKFKVTSMIVFAQWECATAIGDTEAAVYVKTALVGNGAAIEIKGKSSKGKAPGTIKGQISNNCFRGKLPIPAKVENGAQIWFEAKLPKHGITYESNEIPAQPAIEVRKMEWDKKIVHRKEMVKMTVLFGAGVDDGAIADCTVYEYSPEGNHEKVMTNPVLVEGGKVELGWEFDYAGDTKDIPTEDELKIVNKHYVGPKYFFMVAVNGHVFGKIQESGLLEFRDSIKLIFVDDCGSLLKEQPCGLLLPDGSLKKMTSNGNGILDQTDLLPGRIGIQIDSIAGECVSNPDSFERAIAVTAGDGDEESIPVASGGVHIIMVIPPEKGKIEFVLQSEDLSSVYGERDIIVEGDGIFQKGQTDKKGVFSFKPVDFGNYKILVGDGQFIIPAIHSDAQPYPVVVQCIVLPDQRNVWKQPEDNEIEKDLEEGS